MEWVPAVGDQVREIETGRLATVGAVGDGRALIEWAVGGVREVVLVDLVGDFEAIGDPWT